MLRKLTLIHSLRYWLLAWCLIGAVGVATIGYQGLNKLREAFETDARIVHRLLSQRAVQHEAILATLALLHPNSDTKSATQRLLTLYPQILKVERRDKDKVWAQGSLAAAEAISRTTGQAALAEVDLKTGRYQLVLFAEPSSFALLLDLRAVVPWSEWPMSTESSPVRVMLSIADQTLTLQPGRIGEGGWRFAFNKHIAAASQPFDVVAIRQVGWMELPWIWMLTWLLLIAISLFGVFFLVRQRQQRLRAEELLRLGQIARLNTMGELAAGMAHEINQPLTAVLSSTQAATRLLSDDPPEVIAAKGALVQAAEQARRASDVVARLRRIIERPNEIKPSETVLLKEVVTNALHLLEPELQHRGITTKVIHHDGVVAVIADPIALEQIIHNLLMNAIQALELVPQTERQLILHLSIENGQGVLTITDTGLGIASELLPRLFEPFFSTRTGGLGLGLSICESLVSRMGGQFGVVADTPRGASFYVRLPQG